VSARAPDVLLASLGSTLGLRAAEDELAASLQRAGATVALARPELQGTVRTLALTDLRWARAARAATQAALKAGGEPGALIYSTTTAALLWPRPGAIRFDSPAAVNRPGRHGIWQRPVERKRLAAAPLLIPQARGALPGRLARITTPQIVVPIAVEPSGDPVERDIDAITYAADPHKKGLDVVLRAWAACAHPRERLVVTGLDGPPDGRERDGVSWTGALPEPEFRALLRRARVYVTAPRREDYGLTQLQALADGCRVVTTPAPGPYVALPILESGIGWVAPPNGMRAALRSALDDDGDEYAAKALTAIGSFRRATVDALVAGQLLPALLDRR